jgi:AcrR family transcriptional regulator
MGEQDQLAEAANGGDAGEEASVEMSLSTKQQAALELLVAGRSVAETAREVGVARATMFRWLKSDAHFQAAYNRWQHEVQSSCCSRLMAMMDKAVDVIDMSLMTNNASIAMQLLRGMGMIKERAAGATESMEVLKRQIVERGRRDIALKREAAEVAAEEGELGF